MIKLITSVGDVINNDPDIRDQIKVVFIPNFNVTTGQKIYPAADLSEQISTAGKEASGTGNMKFSMNGALTIGTLDGANVEIREEVGEENFFLFGLTAEQVQQKKSQGYHSYQYYQNNPQLKDVIDLLHHGFFSRGDTDLFKGLMDDLLYHDPYLLLADFSSYVTCQQQVSDAYLDRERWVKMSILNAARTGKFSSDRSIREYSADVWHTKPVPIHLLNESEIKTGYLQ
jgi:starch phosphorylase